MGAAERIAAFEAAGWSVQDERWEGASTSGADPMALPKFAAQGGALVITFVAARPAEIPPVLSAVSLEPEQASPVSAYLIRLAVILVAFAALLVLIVVIGGPIITTLVGGSPKPR
ncbi:MAG: hypothetical protein U0838_08780 [Chloroflexota bacterium]